jgi:hypothetical protein
MPSIAFAEIQLANPPSTPSFRWKNRASRVTPVKMLDLILWQTR